MAGKALYQPGNPIVTLKLNIYYTDECISTSRAFAGIKLHKDL